MSRNLKKVIYDKLILMSTDLSKRSGTITMMNHYQRRLHLECGHSQMRKHSAPVPSRAHCPKCPVHA